MGNDHAKRSNCTGKASSMGTYARANLTYALNPFRTTRLSVDKLFVLLSKIAHYIYFYKAYPITDKQIIMLIDQYNTSHGTDINYSDALHAMEKSKILVFDNTGYRFSLRNYLAILLPES